MKMIKTVYTTIDTLESAKSLAKLVVEKKLAVCANIITDINSCYLWDGVVTEGVEQGILFKTSLPLVDKLVDFISIEHAYETPALIVQSVETSKDYFDYLMKTLGEC